jgi:hypothetical protein
VPRPYESDNEGEHMTRCGALAPLRERGDGRGTFASRLVVVAALMGAGGCDIPTAPPRVESRFVIPGEAAAMRVSELLPASVTVENGNFRLQVSTATLPGRSLGEFCGSMCMMFEGLTVPKPAFTDSMAALLHMPADVGSAELASGVVTVTLSHDFGFDPIRPAGATTVGALTLTVRSDGRVVGTTTVTDPFPSGNTVERTIPLSPGTVTTGLSVTAALSSPASLVPVTIRNAARLSGSAVPGPIDISEARVIVTERPINVQAVTLDLTEIDGALSERVKSGAVVMRLNNPFDVQHTAPLELRIAGPDVDVVKLVQLSPGQTTQRVEFTREQIRSLLGHSVTMLLTGRIAGTNGPVRVQPHDEVKVQTTLDLVIELGS